MPSRNVIEIVIKVVDQAKGALQGVHAQVRGLDERFRAMLPNLSTAAKRLAAFAGVAGGIAAVGLAFRKTLTAIEQDEQAIAQLEAGLRSTGGVVGFTIEQLQDMAAEFQNVTAYGDEAINQMQSVLLTFTRIRGDQFKEATLQVANLAARLKVDLQAAALQVGKALNDPILGVSMLSRAGIQFTATQKDMIKSLVESNRWVEAQTIVLKELETQFGGSAEAARKTFSGALQAVANRFGDLFEAGKDVTQPAIDSLNSLEETLNSPGMKAGFAALVGALISAISAAAKLAGFIGEIVAGLNVLAGATGNVAENISNQMEDVQKQIKRLDSPFWRALLGTELADAEIKRLREVLAKLDKDFWAEIDKRGKGSGSGKPADHGFVLQPDAEERIQKAIGLTQTGYEKQRASLVAARDELKRFITETERFTAEQLDKGGVSLAFVENAKRGLADLDKQIKQLDFGQAVESLKPIEVSAQKIRSKWGETLQGWLDDTRTATERATDEWRDFVVKLDILLERGAINATQYNARMEEYLNKTLEPIEVTAKRMKAVTQELSTAGKRAIENIQDALSSFFYDSSKGFKGLLNDVINVFRKMAAEALAVRAIKLFKIEDIFKAIEAPGRKKAKEYAEKVFKEISKGGPGESPLPGVVTKSATDRAREIVEAIKAANDPTREAVQKQTGELKEVVIGSSKQITQAMLARDPCACLREYLGKTGDTIEEAASTVAETVSTATAAIETSTDTYVDTAKTTTEAVGRIVKDAAQSISTTVRQVGAILANAFKKKGGGGGGLGDIGSWVKIAWDAWQMYGGSKGGIVPSRASGGMVPVRVGEEGPEIAMLPVGSRIYNKRQLTFAGVGATPTLVFRPSYSIVIENALDSGRTQQQLVEYLNRRDADLMDEIGYRLRESRIGRAF